MFFDKTINIDGKLIGKDQPVFIIAEIGVNHNGQLSIAKQMIKSAAECGVDCVKFQTFDTNEFLADKDVNYEYDVKGEIISENMFDMFKRLELPLEWHKELFDYCRKYGVIPLTSVADPKIADFIDDLGIGGFKLSSEDFINTPLLEHIMQKKIPLILSTGMADEDEIDDVLNLLKKYNKKNVIFLHCVSIYPTPENEAHLYRMNALKLKTDALVGYSDHTKGIEAVIAATALGACIIEKHFTLNKKMEGPDHTFSSDPSLLKLLVKCIKKTKAMLGKTIINPSPMEIEARKQFRRSIVAKENLPKGHILQKKNIAFKRPGTGLKPIRLKYCLGKKITKEINQNEPIDLLYLKD